MVARVDGAYIVPVSEDIRMICDTLRNACCNARGIPFFWRKWFLNDGTPQP